LGSKAGTEQSELTQVNPDLTITKIGSFYFPNFEV